MMSSLLVANIGRRDFGWLPGVFGLEGGSLGFRGGDLVSSLMWRRLGVFLGGEVVLLCRVPAMGFSHRLSPFLSFSSPFPPSSLRSSQAFFGSPVLHQ
jgi:hypothetical protein